MSEWAGLVADELEHVRGVAFEAELVASLALDCVILVEQLLAGQIASLATNGQVNIGVRACVVAISSSDLNLVDDLVRTELPFLCSLFLLQLLTQE